MQSLPSPHSSPSSTPVDSSSSSATPSRKRQRSQSPSNSSLKRAVSECPSYDSAIGRSPRTDPMSTLSLSDPNSDIDTYMAEQEQGPPMPQPPPKKPMRPIDKLSLVNNLKGRKMEVGETWYLISREWWKPWRKACSGLVDKEGPVDEKDLGPVNNTTLLDEFGNLKPSLVDEIDVEYVPQLAWDYLVTWYGEPIHPIPRQVIARGQGQQTSLELHPPKLKVYTLTTDHSSSQTAPPPYPYVILSSHDTVRTLFKRLAEAVSPGFTAPYRIWRINDEEVDSSEVPISKLSSCAGKIVPESDDTLEDASIESGDAFAVEFKTSKGWLANDVPLSRPTENIISRRHEVAPLFSPETNFFDRLESSSSTSSSRFSLKLTSSPKPPTSTVSNIRSKSSPEPGTIGLGNMGNTCFMNSALQCLAHSKELTEYFLTGVFQDELNPDNPLGMHGAIAEAFGALLQRIWSPDGSSSYSPREFKQQLQRFAPQFSGYQQHDSQELVAFLLDGLHEDLNRVLKKPYVEKPDWEGGDPSTGGAEVDLELVQLAQKSWEGYMKRNDSVIVDLFQGQYQSTLVCPECQKVSITFDPFMYLTLPLPIQKKWRHTVYYIPWDQNKPHVKVPVEIGRDASFRDLRQLLGRWMDAPPDNLLTLEIFHHRFFKVLDDSLSCGEMGVNDTIVCYELPCHAQQSRTYASKKQPDDPFIVPIFLTDVNSNPKSQNMFKTNKNSLLFGYPTVVAITQEQAKDVEKIKDAVVERLERWTSNQRDLYTWEEGDSASNSGSGSSSMEEVSIPINGIPPTDSLTEINENGDVIIQEATPPDAEGDIVDEKSVVMQDIDDMMDTSTNDLIPRKVGTKKDVFTLLLHNDYKDFGTGHSTYSTTFRFEDWGRRSDEAEGGPLLRDGDALFCQFDENLKAYYFGDETSKWDHARWNDWETFTHPEFEAAKKASAEKKDKGIALQDCLDEFTKEEKLGEDDLWYCPRCKKHQQATKKFDLWKAPDILVVHLKRFSNSRTLRDKIDAFIDFPTEGLDLGDMIGERQVARRLLAQGVDAEELHLGNLDEPLVYDLFGVDEHVGGLGGGHYRAYALNHANDKWYHFDDSFVTPSRAADAVNPNAYLLFYRRRSASPLGGKTHEKIEEAKQKPRVDTPTDDAVVAEVQLPTPPDEFNRGPLSQPRSGFGRLSGSPHYRNIEAWTQPIHDAPVLTQDPAFTSLTDDDDDDEDPAPFHFSRDSAIASEDALRFASERFDFPNPASNKASPTSSVEAEPDLDENVWPGTPSGLGSPEWSGRSRTGTPSDSSTSVVDPFADANIQDDDSVQKSPMKID